jgi:Iap family predicted aminopeptidase
MTSFRSTHAINNLPYQAHDEFLINSRNQKLAISNTWLVLDQLMQSITRHIKHMADEFSINSRNQKLAISNTWLVLDQLTQSIFRHIKHMADEFSINSRNQKLAISSTWLVLDTFLYSITCHIKYMTSFRSTHVIKNSPYQTHDKFSINARNQ